MLFGWQLLHTTSKGRLQDAGLASSVYAEHACCVKQWICLLAAGGLAAWAVLLIVGFAASILAAVGFGVYKYRIRSQMHSEIRAIMSQYMPLENEGTQDESFRETSTISNS